MTADVATYQGNGVAAIPATGRPMRLIEWAAEAEAAHRLAVAICATSFCPEAFRNKPGEATAAILAGSEVGLSPIAAMNAYDVIQGRPAPKAMTLRALVQSAGHDVWLESSTPNRAVMMGRRRGSSQTQESVWTMDRARQLGVANKPNWKSQAQAMLVARATSEISRLVGADVILGIPYSSEELTDLIPEPTTTTRRAEPITTTTARRKAVAAPTVQPEPDLEPPTLAADDPIPPDAAPEPQTGLSGPGAVPSEDRPKGDEPIDAKGNQMKALHAGLNEAGLGERVAGLAFMADVLDREVESSKTLTVTEAGRVLDELQRMSEGRPFEEPEPPL